MKRVFHWLDENLEEFLLVIGLIAMTLIMGGQVFCRYVLGMSLSWSEELTRYIFIWCGFLSVSYCSKKCLSIKIEQFVAIFPRRGKAVFKIVNHTFELIFLLKYMRKKSPQFVLFIFFFLITNFQMTLGRTITGAYRSSYMDNSIVKILTSSVFDYLSYKTFF